MSSCTLQYKKNWTRFNNFVTATESWSNDYKGHRDATKVPSPELQHAPPQRATRRQLWKENHTRYPCLTSMKKGRNNSILIYALQSWEGTRATKRVGWRESRGGLSAITRGSLRGTSPSPTSLARTATLHLDEGSLQRGKFFPTWTTGVGAERGGQGPENPKGCTAAVSNRFALTPHFTTTEIASDSYWKSLVFLFGLTVPKARPAQTKELATTICKSLEVLG